jgi:chloramphenicol O-acetyltransferase type B
MLKFLRFILSKYLYCKRYMWVTKLRLTAKSTGKKIFVGGPSTVNNKTVLGEHCSTNGLTVKGSGSVNIAEFVHTGCDLLILSSNHNYKTARKLPYDNSIEDKSVIIGRAVWIGDRVTILGGVTIGEGAILQAGSVVVHDIPRLGIAGGNPAKVFKYRDENNFDLLAKNNEFLYL